MSRPLLYVCAPFQGRTREEVERTDAAIRQALEFGWFPIFVPYALIGFLEDEKPEQREVGLQCCEAIIPACSAFMIVASARFHTSGGMSDGMKHDARAWLKGDRLVYLPETLPRAPGGL